MAIDRFIGKQIENLESKPESLESANRQNFRLAASRAARLRANAADRTKRSCQLENPDGKNGKSNQKQINGSVDSRKPETRSDEVLGWVQKGKITNE